MELNIKDIFTILLIFILIMGIISSFTKLKILNRNLEENEYGCKIVRSNKKYNFNTTNRDISGGDIRDTISVEEINKIIEKNKSIKMTGDYNYNFSKHRDKVMELTSSVVS